MTQEQLQRDIKKAAPQDFVDAIMAKVVEHDRYVIGERKKIQYEDDTNYGDTPFRHQDVLWGQNELIDEQRMRAGIKNV